MRFVTVPVSQAGDRLDAGFHILRKQHEAATGILRARMDGAVAAEHASLALRALPSGERLALAPLMRGSTPRIPSLEDYDRVIRDDPHLALAVLVSRREAGLEALSQDRDDIDRKMAALDELAALGQAADDAEMEGP